MKLYPFSAKTLKALENPPEAGAGRHFWLWDIAYGLVMAGMPLDKVREFGNTLIREYGWLDRFKDWEDILAKLAAGPLITPAKKTPDWPDSCHEARIRRYDTPALFDPNDPTSLTAQEVLVELFNPDDLICIGWTAFTATTEPLSVYLPTAHRAEFIVSNPMTSPTGVNGARRSADTACPRAKIQHLVIEFDTHDSKEQQAAVLSSLSGPLHPLIMAVWSGGKSIHGWFDVARLQPWQKLVFFRFAVYLGADRSLWDRSKLVRMPGGTRANGAPQPILYFNPPTIEENQWQ